MNFLILGGNGYIGSKITHSLIERGNSVVCTKRKRSNISRLDDLPKNSIKWISASIDGVLSSIQYTKFDYVVNTACNYGRGNVLYDDVLDANIEFPLEVLNTVVEHGTNKYLTIGTGLPDELNMYSFSKKMFSEFGRFYVEKHGITFNNLQLEMFYGVDEPRDRFLPSIIRKMIMGDVVETTIGTQHRDIIAAKDIVNAVLMVIDSDIHGYNEIPVGTGIAPTISEVVDYIWKNTGQKSELRKGAISMRENEPDCIADVSFLQKLGKWEPLYWKVGIRDMIKQMEETII